MVINMDETSCAQSSNFGTSWTPRKSNSQQQVTTTQSGAAHISRVLKRFDYPQRNKSERGVGLAYPAPHQRLLPCPNHPPGGALAQGPARGRAADQTLQRAGGSISS
ncbi:MAG: hypothetical protein U5L74_09360 [Ideonella sp.]|nr:hypothetical protein [Ideonella sp.]